MRDSRSATPRRQQARNAARSLGGFALRRNRSEGSKPERAAATKAGNRRRNPVVVLAEPEPARAARVLPPRAEPVRTREWPRKLGRVGLRVGLVLGVAWALVAGGREVYEYATTSARFEVQHLVYEPTEHVDDATLRELLAIAPATNILSLDLEALGRTIAAHPWVAQASVTRNLPDTLAIEVVEHEATAIVLAGRFYLVDERGVPFKQLERGERGELPIITGIEREALRETEARDRAVSTIARGLEVLRIYQAKQRPRLGEIHLGEDGSVTLYTANTGTALLLGRSEFEARLARWDALRLALGERAERLAVVHLDHESKPDRRDRVVARFVSDRDHDLLLAEAALAEAAHAGPAEGAEDEPDEQTAAASATKPKPAARAGRRNRIPRYE